MSDGEKEQIYNKAGREWISKEFINSKDRIEYLYSDKNGVHYLWNRNTILHKWVASDWEVFTPPDDIILE